MVKKVARTKKATSTNVASKAKSCLKCVNEKGEKPLTKFYISYSEMHADNKVPYCKDCLLEMVDVNNVESVKDALRQIDRPFLHNIWEAAQNEGREPFGTYMKNISMHQHRTKTWIDSHFINQSSVSPVYSEDVVINSSKNEIAYIITYELIDKWGEGYTTDEYRRLESFYTGMKDSYEIDTESHRDYLKKICMVSQDMDKVLKKGMIDQYKKLSDVYDKLMKSAKFTAVQRSAADKTGGLNTFSEFAEFAEKQGFVPKFVIENPDIVDKTLDNMMNFTRRLVLGDPNLANIVEASIEKMAEKEAALEAESTIDNFEEEEEYDLSLDDDLDEEDMYIPIEDEED